MHVINPLESELNKYGSQTLENSLEKRTVVNPPEITEKNACSQPTHKNENFSGSHNYIGSSVYYRNVKT